MKTSKSYFEPRPLAAERGKLIAAGWDGTISPAQQKLGSHALDRARIVIAEEDPPYNFKAIATAFARSKIGAHLAQLTEPVWKIVIEKERELHQDVTESDDNGTLLGIDITDAYRPALQDCKNQRRIAFVDGSTANAGTVVETRFCRGATAWSSPQTLNWDASLDCVAHLGAETRLPMLVFGYAEVGARVGNNALLSDHASRQFSKEVVSSLAEITDQYLAARSANKTDDFSAEMVRALHHPWPLRLQEAKDQIYGSQGASEQALCNVSFSCWSDKLFATINCGKHSTYLLGAKGLQHLYGNNFAQQKPLDRRDIRQADISGQVFLREELANKALIITNFDLMSLANSEQFFLIWRQHQRAGEVAGKLQHLIERKGETNKLLAVILFDAQGGLL